MTTKKLIYAGLLLLVLLIAISMFGNTWTRLPVSNDTQDVEPPSPEVAALVEASEGFQYLISYTGDSFEPLSLMISEGETVRFANNSDRDMWIAASTDERPASCADATLNSCHAIEPGAFWEHTFDAAGTIQYIDAYNAVAVGVIIIK